MESAPDGSPQQDPAQNKPPAGGFGIWFAGACVAAAGLIVIAYQSKRQNQTVVENYEFGGQRAGLVNIPQGGNSSMPGIAPGEGSLIPSAPIPLKKPESAGLAPEEQQGPPGVVFSRTLAAHQSFYSQLAAQRYQDSPVVRRFFDDWRHSPDLAKLSGDYSTDADAIKFARGAARSENFARLMKRYTLEGDMRGFGMELLTGSPHDVLAAWTAYTTKDPEGGYLQTELFKSMGVPAPMAQVLGDGKSDAAQIETQVRMMLPALLKGVDPKVSQQIQQQMGSQQQGPTPPR